MLSLPKQVQDLNLEDISNPQMWALAEWMDCTRALRAAKGSERRAALKAKLAADLARAQQGYEVVVLKKSMSSSAGAVPEEMEKRMYSILTTTLNEHKEILGESAQNAAVEAVSAMKKELEKYAREQIKLAAESARPLVIKQGTKTKVVKGVLPPEFKRMVQLGMARKNTMLVGPAGCGKTYLASKLAEALDLDFADQSCSAGISESVFVGWLLPGKGGEFGHVETPFLRIYENGGVFLFDEMDAADANLLTFLNKALANESFYLPQRKNKPLVKRHKDFVAVGAANTYGHGADSMYVGRNQLDAATLDRFRVGMITMDYSREVEEALGTPDLLEWAWNIRKGIRVIKDMADMVAAADWKREDWEASYFADWTREERSLIAEAQS